MNSHAGAERSPLTEVIEECRANADSAEPFLALIFDDAAYYLAESQRALREIIAEPDGGIAVFHIKQIARAALAAVGEE